MSKRFPLPDEIKAMNTAALEKLATDIRETIIDTVSKNGGHLAPNLGVVELTIALLREYDFPNDKIVFDVGHQSYVWKLLTGRDRDFATLRQKDGLSGFPKRDESEYDAFNTGHSSTSISAAAGLARAARFRGLNQKTVALIGDGALTGGMAYEAMNDVVQQNDDLLIIINDNQMSIDENVGGLSHHLEKLRTAPGYNKMKSRWKRWLGKVPLIGKPAINMMSKLKEDLRQLDRDSSKFFEEWGFRYYGPVDGHDIDSLIRHLRTVRERKGPVILHVLTKKGHGYQFAESAPERWHGVAPFLIESGLPPHPDKKGIPTFSKVFGSHLCEMAEKDDRIVAISAAMTSGTGLADFAERYPDRFFDVGIAEQHALTLAAGLAAGGMKPYVALYSTFLQRGIDQIIHDICLQNLPVTIMIDRAGVVPADGETHQGLYDIALLNSLPCIEIFAPADGDDLKECMNYARNAEGPVAVRYPKMKVPEIPGLSGETRASDPHELRKITDGSDVTVLVLGSIAAEMTAAKPLLDKNDISVDIFSCLCAKPWQNHVIIESLYKTKRLFIIEEGIKTGGFGQNILPELVQKVPGLRFKVQAVECAYQGQGNRDELLREAGLTAEQLAASLIDFAADAER